MPPRERNLPWIVWKLRELARSVPEPAERLQAAD